MNSKLKKIAGVVWLLVFVSVLLVVTSVYGGNKIDLKSLFNRSTSGFNEIKEKVVTRQEVVEEESAVINVVDKVSPSVVSIIVKTVTFDLFSGPTASEEGIGTGFIVSENGLVVTNSHVVDSVDGQYSVVLKDGTSYDVESINLDEQSDLAILQIAARNLPAVQLGDSDDLKVGQKAIAIGNALGRFQNTVTTGVVSGVARQLTASSGLGGDSKVYESVIQTDAAINPGNSGGPLLNSAGQVIGINVATTRGADNISFAIPINTLKPILEGFLREGRIIKPFLGISYSLITEDIAKARKMPQGAFVTTVFPNTPAKKAGLERGDVIVKIDGKEINSENSVAKVVSEKKVGDTIQIEIDRSVLSSKTETLTLQAVLEESPNTTR
ncbi:MAG: Protease Do [uncultured bacterium]|nr:MAG: Protease Do [uncultured bacterium]